MQRDKRAVPGLQKAAALGQAVAVQGQHARAGDGHVVVTVDQDRAGLAVGARQGDVGGDRDRHARPVDLDQRAVSSRRIALFDRQGVGLGVELNIDENLPNIYFDSEIITTVLNNLLSNAIKYTEEGSVVVDVSSRDIMQGNYIELVIRVTDTGQGIRQEDRDKLFKSFQRLDEKKNRNIEGTGLGLNITHRLMEMMGGRIEIESEYGKGSTFMIAVPQKVVNRQPIGDFSRAVRHYLENIETDDATLYAPDAHVLVVDDNAMNLEVMEGLLADTAIRVDLAASGADCIQKVMETDYDCIFLDQMMPGMSGEETLKEMNSLDILKDTPVIALTADAIIGAKENYIQRGFTDYISKPVKYRELELVLKEYLPAEKQLVKEHADDLPIMLIWGNDPERLRLEKDRLESIYKCVCVVGSRAADRYMEKHSPHGVIHLV